MARNMEPAELIGLLGLWEQLDGSLIEGEDSIGIIYSSR